MHASSFLLTLNGRPTSFWEDRITLIVSGITERQMQQEDFEMEHQCEWMPATASEQENYNLLRQVILDYERKPENLIQILHRYITSVVDF